MANRHVFARNGEELICASLAAGAAGLFSTSFPSF
jgi:hypothetical protein